MTQTLAIGPRRVGENEPVLVAAEIGINHNGDMKLAFEMIDAAAEAGADSVKFQSYCTEDFVRDRGLTYSYRAGSRTVTESQFAMFKRCELAPGSVAELKHHCDKRGVIFHATPTSEAGVRELVELGAPVLKNGSDYLTHDGLVRAMGESGLPAVLSAGMATLAEVAHAADVFRATGNDRLIVLHCTSSYPTPPVDVNLRKIPILARALGCLVGFSDHTDGVTAAVGAVALGACWIEKHFTLDRALPGPDHAFSADPAEFRRLVESVRAAEAQLGAGSIRPAASERAGRRDFRLSCVAGERLPAGKTLAASDVIFARPGTGIPPQDVELLLGRTLRRGVAAGAVILMEDVQ